jgi:adenylate cyclase
MSTIIMAEQGTVDKDMGDGIMAFWGAPLDVKNHAAQACIATLRCQRRVRELSAKGVSLTTRIGLATGKVLVGNIGSTDRLNYTVMGDTANLASRLEGLNKQYGTESMISEETFEQAREHVVARPIDVVAVKGKKQGVRVFELLALAADNDATAQAVADASTRALAAYLETRFSDAVAAWDEVLALRAGDKAAGIMRDRARLYAQTPPPAGWSGVMVATEK